MTLFLPWSSTFVDPNTFTGFCKMDLNVDETPVTETPKYKHHSYNQTGLN